MARSQHRKWIRFEPHKTYSRRYVDYFYATYASDISGSVLDLGAGKDNRLRWQSISDGIDTYITVDIAAEPPLDVRGDAAQLPFADGTFDTVVLSEVIEHIPVGNLSDVASELDRVLKPGGIALLSTPFLYPEHGPPDHARHTAQSIETVFQEAGFDVTVHRGGGYGESLLHVAYRPVGQLLGKFNGQSLGWLFAVVHYLLFGLSWVVDRLLRNIAGRNPRADVWYLMTFTVARKNKISGSHTGDKN